MIDFFEQTEQVKSMARACGDLVLYPTIAIAEKLSFTAEAAAGIYELYIMAMLRLNGGKTTMDELLSVDLGWSAMKLAVHSLRLKGLIACPDPYSGYLQGHTPILIVEGARPRIPRERLPSMTAFRIGKWVERELYEYRHTTPNRFTPQYNSPNRAEVEELVFGRAYEDSCPF